MEDSKGQAKPSLHLGRFRPGIVGRRGRRLRRGGLCRCRRRGGRRRVGSRGGDRTARSNLCCNRFLPDMSLRRRRRGCCAEFDIDRIGGKVSRRECASTIRPQRHRLRLISVECKRRRDFWCHGNGKLAGGTARLSRTGLDLGARRLGFEPHCVRRRRRTQKIQAGY